ncbi:hypothetical protein [uncultured Limosilactobacillus sp.]|uniref:hypothetical protein n=1 Tax=uncultured Limosilactobacillus sp. TaxID=2837629 RepID=UPI0025FEEB8E|nr:hypothetical protein [uncultured Limosilactobacillus sp.]
MQWLPSHFQKTHDMSALPFRYGELCQVIKITPTISGHRMRIKLTNRFGRMDLIFDQVWISSDPQFLNARQLTFHHQPQIMIAAQHVIRTDPLDYSVTVGHPLYIKMVASRAQCYADFASTYQTTLTNATLSRHHVFSPLLTNRWQNRKGWFCFESLEVESSMQPTVIQITGDSLVESGMVTAELIQYFNLHSPNQICWLQTGIAGNQLCHDAPMEEPLYETFGRGLLKRYQRQAQFAKITIALIGTNDLILPFYSKTMAEQNVTAQTIINGFNELRAICQAHQSQLIATTIAPFRLFEMPDQLPAEQLITRQRRVINGWLREQSWMIDGARTLRNPDDQLAVQYDFGDHLHWNPSGGQALTKLLIPKIEKFI